MKKYFGISIIQENMDEIEEKVEFEIRDLIDFGKEIEKIEFPIIEPTTVTVVIVYSTTKEEDTIDK